MMYPWQQDIFQQLWLARQQKRLAHALLFTGVAGIGKFDFALYFTQALLCQTVSFDGAPCGQCHSCHLVQNYAHPNLLLVAPEEEGHAIKVDQIRLAGEFVSQSSMQGDYRVVIIHPAHNMNANAANALLKTLEEPATGAILILLSDQSGHLPATILSRCQRIPFSLPSTLQANAWLQSQLQQDKVDSQLLLKITHGAPLAALKLADAKSEELNQRQALFQGLSVLAQPTANPVQLATSLQELELLPLLHYFNSFLLDILRLQLVTNADVINTDYLLQLQQLATKAKPQQYVSLLNYLQHIRQQISKGINLNKQLLVESLLIRWMECVACS